MWDSNTVMLAVSDNAIDLVDLSGSPAMNIGINSETMAVVLVSSLVVAGVFIALIVLLCVYEKCCCKKSETAEDIIYAAQEEAPLVSQTSIHQSSVSQT